jgi:hypothetical protein
MGKPERIIHNAANENLGKYRKYTKKKLPVWDEEIKIIISNKKIAYKKWLNTKR